MSILEQFFIDHKLNPFITMNQLQDHGIISDLCVEAKGVAEADQLNAVCFLARK